MAFQKLEIIFLETKYGQLIGMSQQDLTNPMLKFLKKKELTVMLIVDISGSNLLGLVMF